MVGLTGFNSHHVFIILDKMIVNLTSDGEKNTEDTILNYKIMTDESAEDAVDFRKYSERLSNIIINSKPRFTVGIYGGWGMGRRR